MPTVVNCPECGRSLRVPDEMGGQPVKCPTCGARFVGAAPPAPPPAAPAVAPVAEDATDALPAGPEAVRASDGKGPPPEKVDGNLLPCPHCGAPAHRQDRTCPKCGQDLADADERPWERPAHHGGVRRDSEPHRGVLILILGILSLVLTAIGLPMGVAAWWMGHRDLKKMEANEMDPDGRGLTQAGWVCGIVGTVLQGISCLLCGAYFGFISWLMYETSSVKPTPVPMTAPVPPTKKM